MTASQTYSCLVQETSCSWLDAGRRLASAAVPSCLGIQSIIMHFNLENFKNDNPITKRFVLPANDETESGMSIPSSPEDTTCPSWQTYQTQMVARATSSRDHKGAGWAAVTERWAFLRSRDPQISPSSQRMQDWLVYTMQNKIFFFKLKEGRDWIEGQCWTRDGRSVARECLQPKYKKSTLSLGRSLLWWSVVERLESIQLATRVCIQVAAEPRRR